MTMLYHRKLQFLDDELTPSERKVADYIDDHPGEIRTMSSGALAAASGVSQPTVIRFSKKLGYGAYKKMINDISIDKPDAFINMDISELDDTRKTTAQIAEQYNIIINMTFSLNSTEAIDRAVEYIASAKRIIVAGYSERNHYFADYLCYRFENIGLDAYTNAYGSLIYAKLHNCDAGDVIIILSESGETRELVNFAKLAKRKGMKVLSITRSTGNTIQSTSDVSFKLVEYGARTFLRSCMIRLSMICIIDMIFLNLIKRDYSAFRTQSVRLGHMTKLAYTVDEQSHDRKQK